jgi:hypothetical protein
MRTHYLTVGLTLLTLTGAVGATETRTQHVNCKGSATFADGVETNIDPDGDGQSAFLDQGISICNVGRFAFQEETEWIHQPTVTTCPAGTTDEYHIDATHGQNRNVATDQKTGNQLFEKIISATDCFNASTFTFTGWAQQTYIGGTGQYTGATGPHESYWSGSYLQFGFKGGFPGPFGGFGQFTFTTDGTLTLPKSGHDKED